MFNSTALIVFAAKSQSKIITQNEIVEPAAGWKTL